MAHDGSDRFEVPSVKEKPIRRNSTWERATVVTEGGVPQITAA